jgi:hypothetical protein
MAWRVVSPNAGLVTNREVLQLLRQRGLRTAAEAAEDEERAAHALETATAALSVREDEEGADEGVGEAAGGEPLRAAAAAAAAEASRAASLPVPLYPRRNPPFRIEREVRSPRSVRSFADAARHRHSLAASAALQVFDYLMQTPAAAQDEEKLERVVDYITTVRGACCASRRRASHARRRRLLSFAVVGADQV